MDVTSTTKFESKLYPGACFVLRRLTWGARQRVIEARRSLFEDVWSGAPRTADFALKVLEVNKQLWMELVQSANVTLDGKQISIEEMYLLLPEDIVGEVIEELERAVTPLAKGDDADEAEIAAAQTRIDAAKEMIALRKNSVPLSMPPQTANSEVAMNAEAVRMGSESGASETATATPTSEA